MISIIPVKTQLIKEGKDPIKIILDSLPVHLIEGDILVVSTKPLILSYGETTALDDITPNRKAVEIASRYDMDPRVVEIVLRYSDGFYGGVSNFILGKINDVFLPNAGVDNKNVGKNRIALPPLRIRDVAEKLYRLVLDRYNVKIGVIITDSTVYPLRRGTRAVALYTYGFRPIKDYRGKKDLFGRKIRFTQLALADEIASAAHIVMGEGTETVPAAIVRGVEVELIDGEENYLMKISMDKCIYRDLYQDYRKRL